MMRAATNIMRWLAWPVIVTLLLPLCVLAQDSEQAAQSTKFKKEELAQMLAPIALYPDSLVADILMASTYPLEVVDAERWLRENKDLKGDALNDALREKPWDASIKVLCHFPEVLFSMSDKLDQTRKLGDAFLGQQEEVMATVQELRRKAVEQGNLKSTKEQNVVTDKDTIKIEPVDPRVVYVPVYDPLYVYGPWWYPAYPPYYWYWPSGVYISGGHIGFSLGFFIGMDLFSWFWFDWPLHVIYVDHVRARHYDRYWHDYDRPYWRHNPYHRRGVAYRDRHTSEHYGGVTFRVPPPIYEKRGYPERRREMPRVAPPLAPSPVPRRRSYPEKRSESPTAVPSPAPAIQGHRVQPQSKPEVRDSKERNTPFTGIGHGGFERRASERGDRSRQGEKGLRLEVGPEKRGERPGKEGGPSGGFKRERRQK